MAAMKLTPCIRRDAVMALAIAASNADGWEALNCCSLYAMRVAIKTIEYVASMTGGIPHAPEVCAEAESLLRTGYVPNGWA